MVCGGLWWWWCAAAADQIVRWLFKTCDDFVPTSEDGALHLCSCFFGLANDRHTQSSFLSATHLVTHS